MGLKTRRNNQDVDRLANWGDEPHEVILEEYRGVFLCPICRRPMTRNAEGYWSCRGEDP